MIEYEATITLNVTLSAFCESDALDILEDMFGEGDDGGLIVTKYELEEFNVRNSK